MRLACLDQVFGYELWVNPAYIVSISTEDVKFVGECTRMVVANGGTEGVQPHTYTVAGNKVQAILACTPVN